MRKLFIFYILFQTLNVFADVVDIKADHFYANDISKEAFFEGNAQIKQEHNEFNASKIKVLFNDQKKAINYEATGNVNFNLIEKKIHYKGKAQKVVYAPKSSNYFFYGDVVLEDLTNNRTIKAQTVSLDLKTGLADIKGKDNKPIHFRFEIEDRK